MCALSGAVETRRFSPSLLKSLTILWPGMQVKHSSRQPIATTRPSVDVTVLPGGDPFGTVSVQKTPDWKPNNCFAVKVDIESSKSCSGLQYRLSSVGNPEGGQWVEATSGGESLKATLTSPDMRKGRDGERYHLRIDARDESGKTVASYPLSFTVGRVIHQQEPGVP